MQASTMLYPYVISDKLGESLQASVFKGHHRDSPAQPVVLKQLKLLSSWGEQSGHLRQKVHRLRVLHDPRVCTPLALESEAGLQFIVQPWFSGVPLDRWAAQREAVSLGDFFTIACALADTLQAVHEAGIIHGGVKPHNILIQPDTLSLRLTDFITPLDIRDVSHFIFDPEFVRATLAYASPEQTGRINYPVDFSTDLYSLGIVLYELLTETLPFFSTDPLVLIHAHLAQEPALICDLKPALPRQLAQVVARLLLKQPEKRYQSAAILLEDLLRCRDDWAANGSISSFPTALRDHRRRVIPISKMVGRLDESAHIQREYATVTQGAFRAVCISGYSGIGKTRLIQELQQPLVRHRGYFTSGKFDQYQKNIPYSSLIQALRNLVRIFLTESEAQVQQWRRKILDAVGTSAKLITDVVPELEFIIGAQPEVAHMPAVEAGNRFHHLFGRFLACVAAKEHPLVLFVDDLQCCDSATFDFLHAIFANHAEHPYLLFLGAYRHNEVDSAHPLTRLIRQISEQGGPLAQVRIGELNAADCHEMVAYILDSSLPQTAHLAAFIEALTDGNPLFVSESLAWLYNENLLHADDQHEWQWDMSKIRDTQMPARVVELFSSKVSKLPAPTLHILNCCACMGKRFTAKEVALVLDDSLEQLFEDLKPVLRLGMLLESQSDLQFVHDRVQEAVLRQVPLAERANIHWLVGQRLLQDAQAHALEKLENLFTIAAHLNRGRPTPLDEDTAYRLAQINFHAGNKALDALASEAANEFYRMAHDYLPRDSWVHSYALSYRVHQRLAKTELMCGRYEEAERLLDQLIKRAVSDLDKAEALAEQTRSLSSFGNFNQAIETANRGLAYLDKSIEPQPELARQRMQSMVEQIQSQGDVWERILQMPFSSERKSKIELTFYAELIPNLYLCGLVPQLYLAAAQSTLHCLQGSMDESVIYSFSIMGLNLGEQEQFELAFRYEDLARELCAKYPNSFGATRGINGIVWCNMHSRSHPAAIVAYCLEGIQCGRNCGDLYNAGLSYAPLMWNLQAQGADLQQVEDYAQECLEFSRKNQLSFPVGLAQAVLAGWVEPMKPDAKPVPMQDTLVRWAADNYVAASGSYYVLLGMSHYFRGEFQAAAKALSEVERHLHGLTDNVLKRLWFAFRILLRLRQSSAQTWPKDALEIAPWLKKIQTWAALGPLLRPYLALIDAQIACLCATPQQARNAYLDAIALAQQQGYGLLVGHLHELLADWLVHCEARGVMLGKADMYYNEAQSGYEACKAPGPLARLRQRRCHAPAVPTRELAPPPNASATLPNLDTHYLAKSALALSCEIDLAPLLQKIMTVALECSGAQHGYLMIKENGVL
ncbi:MAG: AAA family ATPase, partial [Betaproteobacteria bacterium]